MNGRIKKGFRNAIRWILFCLGLIGIVAILHDVLVRSTRRKEEEED